MEKKSITIFNKYDYENFADLELAINNYLETVYEVGDKLENLHSDKEFIYLTIISN
jgi:hypothetical protein